MNATLLRPAICAGALVGITLPLLAAPLQRSDVPADPVWVFHLDCDNLRSTAIGQHLLAEMEKPAARFRFAAFRTLFNFDPRKQLHGLTLYSRGNAPEEGVLQVYADFEEQRLLALAKAAKDYGSTQYKQHVVHNWIDEQKVSQPGVSSRVYAAFHAGRIVVLARQESQVAQALDVLGRATRSLASSSRFAQLGASGRGQFIQAAVGRLNLAEMHPAAAVLRLAKAARLEVGEAQGQFQAILNFEANDEEAAVQMASVGGGLLALMKLRQDEPGMAKLADGIALRREGAGVVATLAVTTNDAVKLMQADAAGKAQKDTKAQ